MFSDEDLRRFLDEGAVTVDTPLTAAQIAAAVAAVDRLLPQTDPPRVRAGRTCDYDDPALLEILQHPFFEEVAKQVLRADAVEFFQTALIKAWPEPGAEFTFEQHVDIQYETGDWEATPRRVVCSFFLWLDEVNARRAPMMYRPGSHRLLAAARAAAPQTTPGEPRRVAGYRLEELPALPYAAPVPATARAGQVTIVTTAAVHGASRNVDDRPRYCLVLTYVAAGVPIGLPPGQAASKRVYDAMLHSRFRPERAHLVAPAEA